VFADLSQKIKMRASIYVITSLQKHEFSTPGMLCPGCRILYNT